MQNKRNFQKELDRILETEAAGRHVQRAGDNVDSVHTAQRGGDRGGIQLPALLLHSCCAPCSSYVLEYLSHYFRITVLYYNPNIYPEEEYWKRVAEERRLIKEMGAKGIFPNPVRLIEGRFDSREFYEAVRGLEQIPEGGARCAACFRLRLEETAKIAGGQTETALDVSAETGSCRRLENADASEFHAGECDIGEDHVAAERYAYFTTTLTISPLKNAQVINEIGEELAAEYQVKWLPCDFKKRNGYKRSIELSAEYGLYRQDYCGCVYSKREREAMVKARK